MSITIVTIGDPHFMVKNINEMVLFVRSTLQLCERIKPDLIVVLGDILDRHESIHVEPLINSIEFLTLLSEIAELIILIGNHDRPNNSDFLSNKHPFSALHRWSNTTVVDKPIEHSITKDGNSYKFLCVPYVTPGRFMEAIETLDTYKSINDYNCVFAHQEFVGAKMGIIKSVVGDPWDNTNPLCVSGHIHDYDKLQHNMIYTGTPIQHAFGDTSDKTISIYTFYGENTEDLPDNVNVTGINNHRWTEERIDLKLMKKKIFYITTDQVMSWVPPKNVLSKLVIKGTKSEIQAVMKLKYIGKLKRAKVKITYKTVNYDNVTNYEDENVEFTHINYLDALRIKVTEEPSILQIYNELFC